MDETQQVHYWTDRLDERERKHVEFCRNYAEHFAHGAPGHYDFVLIAKLADWLHELSQAAMRAQRIQQVVYDHDAKCWRDIETGMRVER